MGSDIDKLFQQTPHPKEVNDYYHCYNSNNILNTLYWWNFFKMVSNVKGDIVECGVGRGRSLITILSILNYLKHKKKLHRKVFALDSFEGFPNPSRHDQSSRKPKKGEWSTSPNKQFKYSIKELKTVLRKAELKNLNYKNLKFVKGFFEKTTVHLDVKKISILHLDGDLYNSILNPLDNLWKKISIGGIVVIDDYVENLNNKKKDTFPGARRAVKEFLKNNKNFHYKISIRGTPFLIKVH